MKVFAAVNPEDGIRLCSSSGGVFTLLSHYVMGLGGVVCGAVFDKDFHVEHRIVDSCEALALLRGSKYVYGRSAHSLQSSAIWTMAVKCCSADALAR